MILLISSGLCCAATCSGTHLAQLCEHPEQVFMVFGIVESSHMPDDKGICKPKLLTHLFPFFRVKGKPCTVDRIRDKDRLSFPDCFFSVNRNPSEFRTGKEIICQISPKEPCHGTFKPLIHSGTSRVGCGFLYACFLCDRKIDGRCARHMSLYQGKFMMLLKEFLQCFPIRKIVIDTKTGNPENTSSQFPDLLFKKAFFSGMHQKIKLYTISVCMTVQIHDPALRSTKVGIAKYMEYPHCFSHVFYPFSFQ